MTPVISPWIFYLMPVCENIRFIFNVLAVLSTIASVIMIICYIADYCKYDDGDEESKRFKKMTTKVTIFAIVLTLMSCLIPSEKTITKMIIAQNVTYERVEFVGDTVESVYNDIMELFDNKETE